MPEQGSPIAPNTWLMPSGRITLVHDCGVSGTMRQIPAFLWSSQVPKNISFDQEAQEAMRRGVQKLARAVRVTLGPCGRNVIIEKSFGSPTITRDGVTVARGIELPNRFEEMGARLVRESASKTSDTAGDGATTATVLAEAIYVEGLKAVVTGVNPIAMKRGMDKAVEQITAKLKAAAVECKTKNVITQVGTVAAKGDSEIGNIIADVMEQVGEDAVITIEDGKSLTTTVAFVQGMQFDRGYLSPYFVNTPESMQCVLEDCYVLLHEEKLSDLKDSVSLLEQIANSGKPLLIIADDVEGEALTTLVVNKLRNALNVCAVKAPGFGDRRKAMLQDMASMVGGRAIFEDSGIKLENVQLSDLGRAKRIVVDKDNTTIIEGHGRTADLKSRIEQIRLELATSTSDYDRAKLEERLTKLSGGVAKINVGAATESEKKEKKTRLEDALHATRAAVEEGILPGGGVALLRASLDLKAIGLNEDESTGFHIIIRACRAPLIQIANNSGVDGVKVCERVAEQKGSFGYNAETGNFEDLFKAGIIDSLKVTRSALQNGASVATLLLTSDAMITELPDDDYEWGSANKVDAGPIARTATRAPGEMASQAIGGVDTQAVGATRTENLRELTFGLAAYPLKQPLTAILTRTDHDMTTFEIKELPALTGRGPSKQEAQQHFARQFHTAFQSQLGVPEFRRTPADQKAWAVFEAVVDIEKYKASQPIVTRQIGLLRSKDDADWDVWWLSGDTVESIALEVTPPEFAGFEVGQWFEGLIERDRTSLSIRKILYVKHRPPLKELSPGDAEAWLQSLPTGDDLPDASTDLSTI